MSRDEDSVASQIKDAILNHDGDLLLHLVQNDNFDVNERDISQDLLTLLMKVCYLSVSAKDVINIIHEILERDPDVNIQDSIGRTAVMHACLSGRSEIADCLISDPDTRIDIQDFDGNSVLFYAVRTGCVAMVKRILEHPGGSLLVDLYNYKGQSPMSVAEKDPDSNIYKVMCAFQRKILKKSKDGLSKRKQTQNQILPPIYSPRCEKTQSNINSVQSLDSSFGKENYGKTLKKQNSEPNDHYFGSNDKIPRQLNANKEFSSCEKLPESGNEVYDIYGRRKNRMRRESFSSEDVNEAVTSEFNLPAILLNRSYNKKDLRSKNDTNLTPRHKGRRNSLSLPDLRDMPGSLVASNSNTPLESSRDTSEYEISDEDDNVFTSAMQPYSSPKPQKKVVRKSKSEMKITFPKIPVKRTLTEACVFSNRHK